MLYWPFYASWLMPWTFIAIGAVLTPRAIESGADWIVLALSAVDAECVTCVVEVHAHSRLRD
jgi:hypothetical protein